MLMHQGQILSRPPLLCQLMFYCAFALWEWKWGAHLKTRQNIGKSLGSLFLSDWLKTACAVQKERRRMCVNWPPPKDKRLLLQVGLNHTALDLCIDAKEAFRRYKAFLKTVNRAHVNPKHQNCVAYLLQALKSIHMLQHGWSCCKFTNKNFNLSLISSPDTSLTLATRYTRNTDSQQSDPAEPHFKICHEIHLAELQLNATGFCLPLPLTSVENCVASADWRRQVWSLRPEKMEGRKGHSPFLSEAASKWEKLYVQGIIRGSGEDKKKQKQKKRRLGYNEAIASH